MGLELSAFNFGREDLVRRASAHLPLELQKQVVEMIVGQRRGILSPDLRPMQPGGAVLAGATAGDRDAAFLFSLARVTPKLALTRVDSLAGAKAVRDEVLAVDLTKLRVGIEMNRLSEDGFHGKEHATLAHWIPDTPVASGAMAEQDAYVKNPGPETLAALDAAVLKTAPQKSTIQMLSLAKYRALLVLADGLRVGLTSAQFPPVTDPLLRGEGGGNPFWQVAEIARTSETYSGEQLGLPPEMIAAKSAGPAFPEQMKEMRLPWYWLGWIADPALTHSGEIGETRRADYFTQTLLNEGPYPSHALFMLFRKLLAQPAGRPFEVQFSFLILNQPLTSLEPKSKEERALFRQVAGNAFRAMLYLLRDDLKRTGKTYIRESQLLQVRQMAGYLKAIGEPEDRLVAEVTTLINAAAVVR
jgi:hypothetical protein